jgi:hypothetical protein
MRSVLRKLTTPILVIAALTIGITAAIAQTGDTVKKGFTPPKVTGTKQLPGQNPPTKPKQPVDPQPKGSGGDTGGGDLGYDPGGPGSGGGYIGDPNYGEGHKKF